MIFGLFIIILILNSFIFISLVYEIKKTFSYNFKIGFFIDFCELIASRILFQLSNQKRKMKHEKTIANPTRAIDTFQIHESDSYELESKTANVVK